MSFQYNLFFVGVCGNFSSCEGSSCNCGKSDEEVGICRLAQNCDNLTECAKTFDCPRNYTCSFQTCCQFETPPKSNVCLPITCNSLQNVIFNKNKKHHNNRQNHNKILSCHSDINCILSTYRIKSNDLKFSKFINIYIYIFIF